MRTLTLILALLASPAWGQITSSVEYGKAIHLADGVVVTGDFLIVPDGGSVDPIPVARITFSGLDGFPPDAITVEGETQSWGVAEVYETHATETDREYLVFERGKIRVELQATDFVGMRIGKERIVVEIPGDVEPDPPKPDDPDPPAPDIDVPNAYGIGATAYKFAVKSDTATARAYQSIYDRAGDFLYGTPSLKFISSGRPADDKDPNRSVIAWINQEAAKIQCKDQATCEAWDHWRAEVSKAFQAAQQKRQFTRDDWFFAFNELADALGAVK